MPFNDFSRGFKSGFDYIHDYDYSQIRESLYYMLFQDINDPYPYFASALIFENLYKTYPTIKTSITLYDENLNNLFTKSNGIVKSEINWNYFFDYKFSLPSFFEILHLTIGKESLDILSKYKENLLLPFLRKGMYNDHFSERYYGRYANPYLLSEISQVLLEINQFPIKELIKINKNFGWDYDRKNFKSSGIHWNYIFSEINKSVNKDHHSFINKLINLFLRQYDRKAQQAHLKDDYTRVNLKPIYISPDDNLYFKNF